MPTSTTKEIVFLRDVFSKNQEALIQYVEKQKGICEKLIEAAKKLNTYDFVELAKNLKQAGVDTSDIDEMLSSFGSAAKTLEEAIVDQKNNFEELVKDLVEIKTQVSEKMTEIKGAEKASKKSKAKADEDDD